MWQHVPISQMNASCSIKKGPQGLTGCEGHYRSWGDLYQSLLLYSFLLSWIPIYSCRLQRCHYFFILFSFLWIPFYSCRLQRCLKNLISIQHSFVQRLCFFFCIVSNTLPNIYKDYMYVNVEDHRLDKLESKLQTFVSRKWLLGGKWACTQCWSGQGLCIDPCNTG